jgi:hypothetical protein
VTITLTDYAYFTLVGIGLLLWLIAVALYVDKSLRERRYRKQARGGPTILDFTAGRVLLPGDEGYAQALRRGERNRRKQVATAEGLPPEAVQEWIL